MRLSKVILRGLLACLLLLTWISSDALLGQAGLQNSLPSAQAAEERLENIPPSLRPWVPWVLNDLSEEDCASVADKKECLWPKSLSLQISQTGATFQQEVFAGAPVLHVLPGQKAAWPEKVKVDGVITPVMAQGEDAVIQLEPGSHLLSGRFVWPEIPETLRVGKHTALLQLTLEGREVPLIQRKNGQVWLKALRAETSSAVEADDVSLKVFRQIKDAVPLLIETRLQFQVAGSPREIELKNPLLQDTAPLSVEGDLALALSAAGTLRVQLIAGQHEIRIMARSQGMPVQLLSAERKAPWPQQEVWTFLPAPDLRSVEVSGAQGIDASRTEIPQAWSKQSAYLIENDTVFTLATTRRGEEQLAANHINLRREFVLDADASAFTVRDSLSGDLKQNWRLDLLTGQLGALEVSGKPQVITQSVSGTASGVELRDVELKLTAVSRLNNQASLPAVGWSQNVDDLRINLSLPPGWDLLAVQGVDDASNTWMNRWDLFSVFFVLLTTLALGRLMGVKAALVAAVALVLGHGEDGAPEYIWLFLIGLSALLALLSNQKLRFALKLSFYSLSLFLALSMLSFSVAQVRSALYPHLSENFEDTSELMQAMAKYDSASESTEEAQVKEIHAEEMDAASEVTRIKKRSWAGHHSLKKSKSARLPTYAKQNQLQPNAVVQVGPGIPQSTGKTWDLTWSGPVVKQQKLQLYLLSPLSLRFVTALRLLSFLLLAWLIWRSAHKGPPAVTQKLKKASTAALHFLLLLSTCAGFVLLNPDSAQAEEPSDARLAELKRRLRPKNKCEPHCIAVPSMKIAVDEKMRLQAEVHAAALSAYQLPGPASALASVSVKVDGKKAKALRLEESGAYTVRLTPGVHQISLEAILRAKSTTLELGVAPQRLQLTAKGWRVGGVNDAGQVESGTLTFEKTVSASSENNEKHAASQEKEQQISVPAFFHVRRSIGLAVAAEVQTLITRQSDLKSAEVFELRLLPGESVVTPGVEVKDSIAFLPFPREVRSLSLTSTLALADGQTSTQIVLHAPSKPTGSSETWQLSCGVIWNCTSSGLVASSHLAEGHAFSTWHPWPEETLTIDAQQLPPIQGESAVIEKATLSLTPGLRMGRGDLEIVMQASRQRVQNVSIPASAQLESLKVNDVSQAVKSEAGLVRLALEPGRSKIELRWKEPQGLRFFFSTPKVSLGSKGVNFRTSVDLPDGRWLLLAGGPSYGPAVLFWGYLVLIFTMAFLLPRLPFSPLKSWQWLLLGLGLTQIPGFIALLICGWFFAVGSRSAWPQLSALKQNALHVALAFYTLVFLICLAFAVYGGLVSSPDMQVQGAGSYGRYLAWFSPRSSGEFESAWVLSTSIWVWRVMMLLWALWLALSLLSWLKWAWQQASAQGLWQLSKKKKREGAHESVAKEALNKSEGSEPAATE